MQRFSLFTKYVPPSCCWTRPSAAHSPSLQVRRQSAEAENRPGAGLTPCQGTPPRRLDSGLPATCPTSPAWKPGISKGTKGTTPRLWSGPGGGPGGPGEPTPGSPLGAGPGACKSSQPLSLPWLPRMPAWCPHDLDEWGPGREGGHRFGPGSVTAGVSSPVLSWNTSHLGLWVSAPPTSALFNKQ